MKTATYWFVMCMYWFVLDLHNIHVVCTCIFFVYPVSSSTPVHPCDILDIKRNMYTVKPVLSDHL